MPFVMRRERGASWLSDTHVWLKFDTIPGVASSAASGAVLEDDVREALLQPAVHTVNAHDVAVCAAFGSSAFVADMEQIALSVL